MENTDFAGIIGNTSQAPSGGSTFGLLGNPIEYNPHLTIHGYF